MTKSDSLILHLSLIPGLGPSTVDRLIQGKPWDFDLEDLYQMKSSDIARLFRISLNKTELIVDGLAKRHIVEEELDLIEQHSIDWVTRYHKDYPALLKEIHSPPTILYWQGAQPATHTNCIAIIGSRQTNFYGMSAIEYFTPSLVAAGYAIVSGGAIGADTAAHRVTIDSGGKTVVVLGSGLLCPYPASNKSLFKDVVAHGGTLLSSFPLRATPLPENFPARNRIISGMSRGCLVIQAASSSGTQITARYALEQGKELFAIPGPFDDPLCAGCHSLIQQGAKLVTSVDDILSELEYKQPQRAQQLTLLSTPPSQHKAFKADGIQAEIIRSCTTPCTIEDLAVKTGTPLDQLYTLLFELELSGAIKQYANGTWQRR